MKPSMGVCEHQAVRWVKAGPRGADGIVDGVRGCLYHLNTLTGRRYKTRMARGNLEVVYSGEREGKFLLYCISEIEDGRYIVFTLEPHGVVEPNVEPNREMALTTVRKFFFDTE